MGSLDIRTKIEQKGYKVRIGGQNARNRSGHHLTCFRKHVPRHRGDVDRSILISRQILSVQGRRQRAAC